MFFGCLGMQSQNEYVAYAEYIVPENDFAQLQPQPK